jgi:hypothetical protein
MRVAVVAAVVLVALMGQRAMTGAQPALTVAVASDRAAYAVGAPITFTLTVTNPTDEPAMLLFPSGQMYDFAVSPLGGRSVAWRWGLGRVFTQAFVEQTLAPHATLTFSVEWDQRDAAGQPVGTGVYTVAGVLTTSPPRVTAVVPFVIGEEEVLPAPGCFTVPSPFPSGTPVWLVAAAFEPPEVLQSLWQEDRGRWLGWAPGSALPNDLVVVGGNEPLRVCITGPGRWIRPV